MIFHNMLEPGKIGTMTTKNRVIFPAMGTMYADSEGFVTDRMINYYAARARGGCGLIIVEFTAVNRSGKGAYTPGAFDDKFIPGLTRLARAIREAGGKSCLQIAHPGRQQNSVSTGMPIVAPSPIPCPLCQEMPRELTTEEVKCFVSDFGDAALRAKKSGFDAVEIHGAHGYLINQFMSPYSNKRTDEYGGSFLNRARFALEVINNVREKVGPDFPVLYKIGAEELVQGGLTIEDAIEVAKIIEKAGIDALTVSMGVYETVRYSVQPIDVPVAFNMENASVIKSVVSIPVAAIGRINDTLIAEKILDEGKADYVAIGRGQIADPEFVNKTMRGDIDEIVKCVGCLQGCGDNASFGLPITCLRNPSAGLENEYIVKPAQVKKKILIVGGGPAGLEAATTLKKRGHDVVLYEKSSNLGGQFYVAGISPRKQEISDAALQMGRIAKRQGVEINLQTEVTPEIIEKVKPDVVVVAAGTVPFMPNIPGIDKDSVVTASDVLKGIKTVKQKVAILGGGLVGCETAEFLTENGKEVTIIEMLDEIAKDIGFSRKSFLMEHLIKHAVKIYTGSKCLEIKESSVVIENKGNIEEINEIESVVVAAGVKPNNNIAGYLEENNIEYYVIGDALKARKALDAIREAAEIARKI